jgi:hypothetical protein
MGSSPFGRPWAEGDVVGCLVQCALLPAGEGAGSAEEEGRRVLLRFSFTLNGEPLGTAFDAIRPFSALRETTLVPALSLEAGESLRLHLGGAPFAHPPAIGEALLPLAPPPAGEHRSAARASDATTIGAGGAGSARVSSV